jgi:hypothetical protein
VALVLDAGMRGDGMDVECLRGIPMEAMVMVTIRELCPRKER